MILKLGQLISTTYHTVRSTIWTKFSEFKDFLRKIFEQENMSILYEELCDNLFIFNILFFICKSSYDVKDIDVTKHVVAIVVTASKTSKSYVTNQFHFHRSNSTFL